jgi:hypothetical protein
MKRRPNLTEDAQLIYLFDASGTVPSKKFKDNLKFGDGSPFDIQPPMK